MISALLLAAAIVSPDFGVGDSAILWRSALDEQTCVQEWASTGRQDGLACRVAHLAELKAGAAVEVLTDVRGLCSSRRARLTRVRVRLAPGVDAIGCLFRESVVEYETPDAPGLWMCEFGEGGLAVFKTRSEATSLSNRKNHAARELMAFPFHYRVRKYVPEA